MKLAKLAWIIVVLALPLGAARADDHLAASVSRTDVVAAYNACSDGDTLVIPAGSATWTSKLIVQKGITIRGAGIGGTVITCEGGAFQIKNISDKAFRLCHFTLDENGYWGTGTGYPVQVLTSVTSTNTPFSKIRIDHVYFEKGQYVITLTGINVWGVIDHCTFHNCDNGVQLNGGSYVWKYPITAGTTNCMVIEDCNFICDAPAPFADMNESIMSGQGVRFVVRHNTFDGTAYTSTITDYMPYENHGKGGAITYDPPASGNLRGPPIFEIYQNTMETYKCYRHMNIRGGSCLVWSNTLTSVTGSVKINVTEDNYDPDGWSGIDQIENSFFWGNTANGVACGISIQVQTPTNQIILDRDYFLHAPDDHSGIITWSDWPGSHNAVFTAGVAQAYYPYVPLVYPHPIVTAQDYVDRRTVVQLTVGTLRGTP